MLMSSDENISVFISYSHEDSNWLFKLKQMLAPLEHTGKLDLWDDTRIRPGVEWKPAIENALKTATVAVLLVSPAFLSSEFIHNEELPVLLNAARERGLLILWVPLSSCLYKLTPIAKYQAAYDPSTPLDGLSDSEQRKALLTIAEHIQAIVHP